MRNATHVSPSSTLLELLEERAALLSDAPLFHFVEDSDGEQSTLPYSGLLRRAHAIGACLQQLTSPGERAVLLYPPGLEYVSGFFGCLASGIVAVPAYPPDPTRLERTLPRLRAIVQDCQASVVLTTSFILSMAEHLFESAPDLKALRWVATDELPEDAASSWHRPALRPDSLAFLQYTSGSTGTPKGVMLSHANLLHNLKLIHGAFGMHPGSAGVIWLPPYHDMGLIGGILGTVYGGFSTSLLSPLTFLRRPLRWLEVLSRTHGTISGGPNFAFDLCVRKTTEAERASLDLSPWEVAFCGAEPIRPETLERFAQAFAPSGFRREAFYPCYGLAEGTLIVSGGEVKALPVLQPVDTRRLREGHAEPAQPEQPHSQTLVGCGHSLQEQEVRVVHPETLVPCAPGAVGEVWVKGPSVALGYWGRPEDTARDFQARTADGAGPFLRTGDQGFLQGHELFITGRIKDLIIVRGRNHHPQDLELTAEQASAALRPGCGAAFSVEVEGEERLVLVYEADTRRQPVAVEEVARAISQQVAAAHELRLHALTLITPGSLSKTSSGKIQRRACRAAFLAGELQELASWREQQAGVPASNEPRSSTEPMERPGSIEETEEWLRTLLARRLKVAPEQLERDAPLTRYGVDSLAAVELAYEVEKGLGVALPLHVLLGGPTLAELARRLFEQQLAAMGQTSTGPLPRASREQPLPLSFAQQRLWFLDELEPESPLYNLPAAVRLRGVLDSSALERTFAELVRRHESLRTTLHSEQGQASQRIHPEGHVALARVDLGALLPQEREAEVLRLAYEEALRPFVLTRGPLLRTTLLRLSDTEHVLVLCMHHIVSDGWSMGVLVREVASLYAAFSQGQPSPLPELPVQYADHALWQRQWLQGEELERQLSWWKQQLAGAPAHLELPTDKPRPAVQGHGGASVPVRLPQATWEALKALAQREGVTPFMLLLAAFQVLLHRHSGEEDLSVGSPIAGRSRPETQDLIGFFVNTLVLRTRLDGNPSFRELLQRVRETTLGAYAHQDVPFEKLVEQLRPVRDLGRSPLFQVMLVLQPDPLPGLTLPGLTLDAVELESRTSRFDLYLSLSESAQGLNGSLEYATDLSERATVVRLAGHLRQLLEGVLARPEQRIAELPLLTEAERHQVLREWNGTTTAFPADTCIHHLFEAQVARTPDARALGFEGSWLTYRELDERSNPLAHHLRSLGVGPEVRVGLCAERSLELVVGLFAILKAGGAYMPLDPSHPRERLEWMLEDARPAVLLTQPALLPLIPGQHGATVVPLSLGDEALRGLPTHAPASRATADNLAYVLFTSGSTGRPKGVQVPHRTVSNFFTGMDARLHVPEHGVWLAVTRLSFDISVLELLWTLARGFSVVVQPDTLGPAWLTEAVRQHAITHLQCTPSLARALLLDSGSSDALRSLQQMLVGGEALSSELARELRQRVPSVLNMYGPTETTVWSSTFSVPEQPGASVPLGNPIANTSLYVLDAHLQPVPVGVPGELFIGGAGVVRGYLGRPELTAERFLPDPFSSEPGARLYRTGDKVRRRADGSLEFLGRIDFQVKVRGFRIEPGEIETTLEQHPRVRQAVVMAREDAPGDKRLVAYVVPNTPRPPGEGRGEGSKSPELTSAQLRAYLQGKLPEYMVPAVFVVLEALPLNSSGKVDRKALPAPDLSRAELRSAYVAPRNDVEQRLCEVWAQVLGLKQVGIHDNFFEVGGDSIISLQVIARARQEGLTFSARQLFQHQTVAQLAEVVHSAAPSLDEQNPVTRPDPLAALSPRSRDALLQQTGPDLEDVYPLSHTQQGMLFHALHSPESTVYFVQHSWAIHSALDAAALSQAWQATTERLPVLRTSFHWEGLDAPVQAVHSRLTATFEELDWRGLSASEQHARYQHFLLEEKRRGFTLNRAPLMRMVALRLQESVWRLHWSHSHLLLDGWSLGLVFQEFFSLYDSFRSGRSTPPAARPLFRDYISWLLQRDDSADASFWRSYLEGFSTPTPLPADTHASPPPGQAASSSVHELHLSAEATATLQAFARQHRLTLNTLALASWAFVLSRYAGEQDIVFGATVSGRPPELPGSDAMVGLLINTLPTRVRVPSGREPLLPWLHSLQAQQLELRHHEHTPLVQVQSHNQVPRGVPLFESLLVVENYPIDASLRQRTSFLDVRDAIAVERTHYPLALGVIPGTSSLRLLLCHDEPRFSAPAMRRLLEHWRTALEGLVARPEARLEDLSLLSGSERRLVLEEWSRTPGRLPEQPVHRLIEAQARRTPDAPAVRFGQETLTYGELNARANQLAHHLRRLGVGPEVLVALCLERSVELVVAMLATLKAGGAWLALDPSLPAERLDFITSNARAPVLLTHSSLEHLLERRGHVFLVDAHQEHVERESGDDLDSEADANNLAYIIYTSGSTGRPKGTLLTHGGLVNTVLAAARALNPGPGGRVLQFASTSFDASVWDVFSTLLAGACLYMATREQLLPGEPLHSLLREQSITAVTLTPSVLAQLEPQGLPALRTVITGGEACSAEIARRWSQGRTLLNVYGPTEITIVATMTGPMDAQRVSIGRALPNTQVYVLDERMRPVAVGVTGELYIGGVGLARGYLGRPELTAERFVPHPFSAEPGERLYRTGDKVRWLLDGELEFLGRLDEQVKLRGFRIELGEVESVLASHPTVRESVVTLREDTPGHKRLVAYVVPNTPLPSGEGRGEGSASPGLDTAQLRAYLQSKLPEYMVPAAFVVLERLPLNSSGKLDRKALPAPDHSRAELRSAYVAPRNDVERRLCGIWEQLLGREQVGIDDNFFELGGDSIISLQVVARARQVGLALSPRDLFQRQTVAQLAEVVHSASTSSAEQGPVTGPVPLTPVQHHVLAHDAAHAHHFNQSVLLAAREPLEPALLEKTLQHLVTHHDALRLRLHPHAGAWAQENASPDEAPVHLLQVDLSSTPASEQAKALEAEASRLQASFVLAQPRLLRAALFHLGEGQQRLLLVIHHLVVDAVSWRVLLEDLESVYQQLHQGLAVTLPAKTTSFQSWARRLQAHAHSEALRAEAPLWLDEARAQVAPLPTDASGPNTHASERSVSVSLDSEETKLLLQEVPSAWRAHINDVLLTALARALSEWTGQSQVLVHLEGHGREELFADVDLSRTVGWFTSLTPVLLPVPSAGSAGECLRSVRDSLRRLPHHGLGFGLLKWLGPADFAQRLQALPAPQVAFNYLGQLDAAASASRLFSLSHEPTGAQNAPSGARLHVLEVNGSVLGGQLQLSFGYSTHLHHASTIESLAGRFLHHLRSLISLRSSEDARRFSPGDFPLASLSQHALDSLLQKTGPGIEDVYPLSPTQQGMLFHALLSPESTVYFEQLAWTVTSALDLPAFLRAWNASLQRHTLLRSSFHWEGLDAPLQVVHSRAELPFELLDWSTLPASEQRARFEQLLLQDKQRGMDLRRAPLVRLTAIRLADGSLRFLWSHHHLLVDGWSLGVLMKEVFSLYEAFRSDSAPELAPARPFGDYIAWQQRRDTSSDETFWRTWLEGFSSPTPLPADTHAGPQGQQATYATAELALSAEATAALQAFARQHQLTLHTLALASWGLVLSRYSGEQDVVFGNTVAGRPPELSGSDAMVGVFINSLPARVRIPSSASSPLPWLQSLQAQQLELRQYEHSPLVLVQSFSQVPRGTPLFESLLVFENYPLDASLLSEASSIQVRDLQVFERSNYPLTLSVHPGQSLSLRAVYDSPRFEPASMQRLLEHWRQVLCALASASRLGDVSLLSEAERQQVLVQWNDTRKDFPSDACIHHLFEQQVALRPDSIAVEFADARLTYRELDARANQLAHLLRSHGVGPDVLVALCLERSLELIVSLLAILKAGGAYLPLDASYPAQRLAFMLEDAPPRLLLTSRALRSQLPVSEHLASLFVEELSLQGLPTSAPASGVSARNLAYVDFTSGSTGRPKGVAIEHRSVLRLFHGIHYAHLGPEETFLLIAPVSFDASTLELWGPLLFGGRLVVFPPQSPNDIELLSQVLTRHRVTTLHLTAGLFSQVVEHKPECLRGLHQLLTGGDVVSAPHVRRVLETLGLPVTACYGPTESTLFTSCFRMTRPEQVGSSVPIGTPIANTQVYLLDASFQPVPPGTPGELFIGGEGLARGYLSRPELTAERFLPNPFSSSPGARLYRTGDLARWRFDGVLEFLGRIDNQVKVRGYRIELAEVEAALLSHPSVREAVALVREDVPGDKRLVAYVVPTTPRPPGEGRGEGISPPELNPAELRAFLQQRLPEFMLPSAFVQLEALPLTANAKVDRKSLPAPDANSTQRTSRFVEPSTPLEQQLVALWSQVLGTERIGVHDHFFQDLGGNSLSVIKVVARMREALRRDLPLTWLFEHPTIHALARRLNPEASVAPAVRGQQSQARAQGRRQFHERRERKSQTVDQREHQPSESGEGDIAIIGMSGRFPGARSVESFWSNLRQGLESISRFSPEELERMARLPEGVDFRQHPQFVPAGGVLEAIEHFDHGFFDIPLREAQWMDPQQRLFLQCAWAALEDAGYVPERTEAAISLYAGAADSGYLQSVLPTVQHDPATLFDVVGTTTHVTLATKVSFKLGLTGESLMVQTACSTGLVAVHMACQSLLSRQSDLALAGAAKIDVPQRTGYVYQEGLIVSPDGHCRAFDAQARGTVTGNGVAVVALKRLSEALRDGDHVYAVIKGSAINNDGRFKSGFTAPSVQGQAAVIEQALAHAGLNPADIGYVETHGTATPLGDPIEVAALQRAYGLGPEHRRTIPIGSVKTNVGHLDVAAGLAGLIKTALALHHEELPPSLHFERPNPAIDFDAGPFFVNASLRPWKRGAAPRRAAVSSFGVGGTNAHAVLEEALPRHSEPSPRPHQLLLLSARTPGALEERTRQLAAHVEANPTLNLADLAFTLAVGRKGFEHRRALVVKDTEELVRRLRQPPAAVEVEDVDAARERRVAFLFPGQGAQQVGMGRELYESEPLFRQHVDACLGWLEEPLRAEVRTLLRPDAGQEQAATALLTDTRVALPALFTVEYALAWLWMSWGVRPYAVLGHSYGEYVAACLAGVLSLEDGLRLAVARGRLMSQLPPGAMLAVGLPESELRPLLPSEISLAALNAPDRCVISGPASEVERFARELQQREVGVMRLPAPHAFHSADVEPFMPALAGVVASLKRSTPALRYVSSLTGTWARAEQLEDPRYWADQMRQPVRFASGVEALLREGCGLLIEVGPGQDLTGLARACVGEDRDKVKALPSLRRAGSPASEHAVLLRSLGEAWAHGLEVDWTAVHAGERRLRLSLPTYPFEEKRCWVEPARTVQPAPVLPAPAPTAAAAAQPAQVAQPAPVPQAPPQALPRGEIEEQLAALWRERLGVEHVGRDDDFLELGGNSLMAAQLLTRMRDTFGVQLPLADLFDAPTVAGLAQRIEALQQSAQKQTQRQLPLAPRPRSGELALSYVQERVWRAEQFMPGLSAYNMPIVFRLEGPMRVELLERSIQEVVLRHELLRTTYDEVDGGPVQRIHASMHVPLEVVVLSGTREEREAEVLRLAREDAARPFDLVKGPVLRTTLVRLEEDVHVLLGLLHHIASDTLSCVLFMQEVGHTYEALREGRPSPLAPLPLQYADFGAWQKQAIAEGFLEEQQQWWRKQLAGLPRQLDLPTDRPRTERCELTSQHLPVEFPRALAGELAAFSKREGVTSFMTLLAAWKTLLHRYSGQSDILVTTPIANRTHPGLQPVIGYVAHSAALRTDLGGDPTFRELLGRVREVVLNAYAHPDLPYEQLVQELLPERKMGRTRMTDSVCVLHSFTGEQAPLKLAGMRATMVEVPGTPVQWGATMADLSLVLSEEAGRVHGALEYATELFDEARVVRMMEHLRVLLAGAMARPEERLSRMPLLSEAERRAWEPLRPAVSRATVLERLEDQAARHPEAVALLQGERAWTWAELSARARSVAARLRTLGVRTGVPVGVCLNASPEKLMALWGVMRAGGATVSLGPAGLAGLKTYASAGGTEPLLLTSRGLTPSAPLEPSHTLYLEDWVHEAAPTAETSVRPGAEDLACILPTPGAAPAWTFTHRGLARFFETLDERLHPTEGGAWVAASETTADRPELEPLWALSRGLRVVFPPERMAANLVRLREGGAGLRPVELSLSYFADDEDSLRGPKYELLLQGAKFADENGFSAVWTPERHFYSFGGLYPQPGVIAAALATHTRRLHIRAGSVVLPLHDPLLIAEQWSVVDNLSQGRVGVSVAGGWHSHDFVYAPDNYAQRRDLLKRNLTTLREVWRGKQLERRGGDGTLVEVGLRPRPVQRELPIWLTAASNPETFRVAGEIGAGVLTNLLGHDLEQLRPKLALYRESWRRHGHAGRGHVTLMVHTFIGTDERHVLNTVREPLMRYLRSSLDLTGNLLASQGVLERKEELSEQDLNAMVEHGLERFIYQAGLIGTRESGLRRLKELRELDVDEAACLIDFGLETGTVMEGLRELAGLREQLEREATARQEQVLVEGGQGAEELLELARRQGPAILQATAWLARRMVELPRAGEALRPLRTVVVEEASAELATSLRQATGVEVLVSGHPAEGSLLPRVPGESLPLGAKAWVLDEAGQPVPVGVVGELALSGPGLPQGLWRAEEEERRRLVPHPLDARERLYRTGRYARLRADGSVEPRSAPVLKPSPKAPASEAASQSSSAPPALVRVPREQPLPLSFAQQRMWYLQGLDPESAAYNNPFTLRLSGPLDVSALQATLDEMVRRHEVLRTTYALAGQEPVQVLHPPRGVPLPLVELKEAPAGEREAELLRVCQAQSLEPFDLERSPPLRALLVRVRPEEHVLNLVLHHVVSDAWSALLLAHELKALYGAFSEGQPSPLPELPVQYADYAVWQRKWLRGPALDGQIGWWKQQLAGVQPLELPLDKPRPARPSLAGDIHPFVLPKAVVEPLLALGRREGATSFMVVMALYQTLLHRYSGQEGFAVGMPTAGRNRPEVEGLIGCFVNTLALPARFSGQPSFRQLLGRVRQVALGAYAHQELPFERLVEELRLPRDLSRPPVFQVALNLLNTPPIRIEEGPLRFSGVEVPTRTSKFELSLEVVERDGGLACTFEYASDLFAPGTIARMAGHLELLAREAVASPDVPLARLSLLTGAERQQVLVQWNDTRRDFPSGACIHHLFEQQVARTPDAHALGFEGSWLTYRELDERSNQLAHHLRSLGVGPEVRVGLCAERSLELVVGLFAILKAGGAYVPLDPAYPRQRLEWMLEDARPAVLLAQPALLSRLPEQHGATVVPLALNDEPVRGLPTHAPPSLATADNLAYVIFTSGSTGRPKGAMNAHRAVRNRLLWMQQAYGLGTQDVVLQKTPYSFDVSVWEFFWPLMVGARLVLARPGGHQEPDYLVRLISEQHVTTAHFVPSMLQHFLEQPGLEQCTGLRRVVCSGEALSAELTQRCLQRLPSAQLHNLYGPTEAAVDVTAFHCQPQDGRRSIPIGRPIANTVIRVLDAHLNPLPTGVPGELFIGGVQVGRGYLSRPELTAERFIPDPFASEPGERLYRTGDKARWLPDGNLEYLGRLDFQVKVRGLRIELGELEAALEQHPMVRQAVVVVREDSPGNQRLVAYAVPRTPLPPGEGRGEGIAPPELVAVELRTFLKQKLPEYMLPAAFVALSTLPLTASGKVDRKALPPPDGALTASTGYVAPRDDTEQQLASMWSEVLRVERVGIHDNFFALGGHSLMVTQVVSRVRAAFGVELPLREFFEAPTVAELALNILQLLSAQVDEGELESMVTQLDQLGEEEIRKLLADPPTGDE